MASLTDEHGLYNALNDIMSKCEERKMKALILAGGLAIVVHISEQSKANG